MVVMVILPFVVDS